MSPASASRSPAEYIVPAVERGVPPAERSEAQGDGVAAAWQSMCRSRSWAER